MHVSRFIWLHACVSVYVRTLIPSSPNLFLCLSFTCSLSFFLFFSTSPHSCFSGCGIPPMGNRIYYKKRINVTLFPGCYFKGTVTCVHVLARYRIRSMGTCLCMLSQSFATTHTGRASAIKKFVRSVEIPLSLVSVFCFLIFGNIKLWRFKSATNTCTASLTPGNKTIVQPMRQCVCIVGSAIDSRNTWAPKTHQHHKHGSLGWKQLSRRGFCIPPNTSDHRRYSTSLTNCTRYSSENDFSATPSRGKRDNLCLTW